MPICYKYQLHEIKIQILYKFTYQLHILFSTAVTAVVVAKLLILGISFLTSFILALKNFKNFMAPFYGWGSTASRLEPLRGGSLLFTTKFPEISGTYFIDLGRMKG